MVPLLRDTHRPASASTVVRMAGSYSSPVGGTGRTSSRHEARRDVPRTPCWLPSPSCSLLPAEGEGQGNRRATRRTRRQGGDEGDPASTVIHPMLNSESVRARRTNSERVLPVGWMMGSERACELTPTRYPGPPPNGGGPGARRTRLPVRPPGCSDGACRSPAEPACSLPSG